MTPMLRAVLDTNVVIASQESRRDTSPNAEIVRRWARGEFTWLFSNDLLDEYSEKLLERGADVADVAFFIKQVLTLGENVQISFFHVRHYPADADDTAFLLAALNGNATHLVTYDSDLEEVSVFYPEFTTCQPLEFLHALRTSLQGS